MLMGAPGTSGAAELAAMAFDNGLHLPPHRAASLVEKLLSDKLAIQTLDAAGWHGLKQQLSTRAPHRELSNQPRACAVVPMRVGSGELPGPQPAMMPHCISPGQLPAVRQQSAADSTPDSTASTDSTTPDTTGAGSAADTNANSAANADAAAGYKRESTSKR